MNSEFKLDGPLEIRNQTSMNTTAPGIESEVVVSRKREFLGNTSRCQSIVTDRYSSVTSSNDPVDGAQFRFFPRRNLESAAGRWWKNSKISKCRKMEASLSVRRFRELVAKFCRFRCPPRRISRSLFFLESASRPA